MDNLKNFDEYSKINESVNKTDIEKIRKILYKYYRIDSVGEGDTGCSCNGRWFSINDVIRVLEEELL